MSCEIESEFEEIKLDKPVKRVRFSDDIKNVFEYEQNETAENSFVENEGIISDDVHNFEQLIEEPMTDEVDFVKTNVSDNNKILPECNDEVDKLIKCNKQETVTAESYKDSCYLQCSENSDSYEHRDSSPSEYFNNNNDSDMIDLNLLVRETKQMTISPAEQISEANPCLSSEMFSMCSSCVSNSEEDVLQIAEQPTELNSCPSSFARKRSSEGLLIERQTTKLNSCLKNDNVEILSAVDLKNAVFSAWNKVKHENPTTKMASFISEMKGELDTPKKLPDRKFKSRKDLRLKNSKKSARKLNLKESEPMPQKTKEDIEESKMAFRAWKKKKDELLNQHLSETRKKEEKNRVDSLMNERIRRNDAESAYLAWVYHKTVVFKVEKKKNDWFSERENEKLNDKIKRNDEAAKMYYKWLRKKILSKKYNSPLLTEDKPSWTPPGKANSLI